MNRDKFIKRLKKAKDIFNRPKYKEVIRESMRTTNNYTHLVICMEELAELSQSIAKYLRDQGDDMSILEEVADVLIGMGYIQEIIGLSDEDIVSAINVKISRLQSKNNTARIGEIAEDKRLLKQMERDKYYTGGVLSEHEVNSLLAALDPNNPENADMLENVEPSDDYVNTAYRWFDDDLK